MQVNLSVTNIQVYQQSNQAVQGFFQANSGQGLNALDRLSALSWAPPSAGPMAPSWLDQAPRCGCLPAPSLEYSGAPAGKGLSKDPEGFPKGSIRTAGGYTVVPEGKTNWNIFGPGQSAKEKPVSRIWGDPHVSEADGTRWDFTKNSNFRLPDGTLINAQTSSEKGQSVTTGLTIANGADRVNVTGVNTGQPKVGEITQDGYQWRNQHIGANPNRDTFVLGGTNKDVQWFRERGGQMEGLITGAKLVDGSYDQTLDKGKQYFVDPNLRPPLGSAAWGNQLRNGITDQIGLLPTSPAARDLLTSFVSMDHMMAEFSGQLNQLWPGGIFGGLSHSFDGLGSAFNSLGYLGDELLSHHAMSSSLRWGGPEITA